MKNDETKNSSFFSYKFRKFCICFSEKSTYPLCYIKGTKEQEDEKMKKSNAIKIIVPTICAAMLFTGCGFAYARKTATENQTSYVRSDDSMSGAGFGTVGSGSDGTTENTVTSATCFEDVAELFSERDLSAEYDEEVTTVSLNGSGATASSDKVSVSGSNVIISGSGTYILSGTLQNGSIIVEADAEDKVQLVLSGASIHSDSFAAIYVKQADKVFITLDEGSENSLSGGDSFVQQDENNVDAVIFSKDDITLNGSGKLTVNAPAGHGIVGKDEVTIAGGVYQITAAESSIRANDLIAVADGTFTLNAGKDGLHAENEEDVTLGNIYIKDGSFTINAADDAVHANTFLQIDGGSFEITGAEGLEATYIKINGGDISVSASDDGVNAANKSTAYTPTVEINDGTLNITMSGGDTDGVDSNGNLIITGGTVNITGQSSFDCDGAIQFTGGTVIVNGEQVSSIPTQMMGGGMMGGGMHGGMMGGKGGRRG